MTSYRLVCLIVFAFLTLGIFPKGISQTCFSGLAEIASEDFNNCTTPVTTWQFLETGPGSPKWGVNSGTVITDPPSSNCWARFNDNNDDRTAMLISPSYNVAGYGSLSLAFYLEFDHDRDAEKLFLSIHHSNGSALYWNGSEWIDNAGVWLRGVNSANDDYLENFSELIPTSFITGNTSFHVEWFFDDNRGESEEFAVDDFLLCGEQNCNLSLVDFTTQNAETCTGTGKLFIEMATQGTGPFQVFIDGMVYPHTRSGNTFTIANLPIGTYSNAILVGANDCRLVGQAFRIDGPLVYFEDFDDCVEPTDMEFSSTGNSPGWYFDDQVIENNNTSGEPQGSCWAVYVEGNSGGTDRTATAKSDIIDVSDLGFLELSFYYGFDHNDNGEELTLAIINLGTSDVLYWSSGSNDWVGNLTTWLTGSGSNDFSGVFSATIPASFLANNTQFQVQWLFDDNNASSRGFAIDNFSLCGEDACAVNAGTPSVIDAATCDGTGSISIPTTNPTGTNFTASIGGTNYSTFYSDPFIIVTGLPIGTNDILITDNDNGCDQLLQGITIGVPVFAIAKSKTNPTCNEPNGSATVNVTTGSGNYSYLWSANANGVTTATATGLADDNYQVTVVDMDYNCTSVELFNLDNKGTPVTLTIDNITAPTACGQDGSATASHPQTGVNVSYLWSNNETTQTAVSLEAGQQSVTVTNNADNQACPVTAMGNIPAGPDPLSLSNPTITTVSCRGGDDGAIEGIIVSNGMPPFDYLWERGNGTQEGTTLDIDGLSAGNYILFVTDADGCVTSVSHFVSQPAAFTAAFDNTNISCNGDSTGAIDLTMSGGTPPYEYFWGPNYGITEDLMDLTAGTYSLTVTDGNDCIFQVQTTLTDNPELTITSLNQNDLVSCNGGSDGRATLNAAGGVPGYTYLWDNGETTEMATALTGGLHGITVTDALGCTTFSTINIEEPQPISAMATIDNSTCLGSSDGSATLNPTGGTPGYTYNWPDGQNGATANNLDAGAYIVTITDNNNCTATTSVTIGEEAPISLANNQIDPVTCFGNTDGQITVNPASGTGVYTYEWADGTSSNELNNVPAGDYSLTVTDTGNCRAEATFTVGGPDELILTTDAPDSLCGETLILVEASATGGNGGNGFAWDDGSQTAATNVMPNTPYTVSVTDDKGCTALTSFTIASSAVPGIIDADSIEISVIDGQEISLDLDGYFDADASYVWDVISQNAVSLNPNTTTGTIEDLFTQNLSVTGDNAFGEVVYTFSSFVAEPVRCEGSILKVIVSVLQNDGNNILVPNIIIKGSEWGIQLLDDSDPMSYKVSVHNRSGAKVFDKILGEEEWDGGNLQDGVYYYVITSTENNQRVTGAVLLQK